jgi:hypothetical protein
MPASTAIAAPANPSRAVSVARARWSSAMASAVAAMRWALSVSCRA